MTPEINRIHQGDCTAVMAGWPAAFVDTIITDPPYGLHFMGRSWDKFGGPLGKDHRMTRERSGSMHAGKYDESRNPEFQDWCKAWATEAFRIAKPGALMLVCGGPRKFHRMTSGIEDAGWQIRDCLMWLYGSGFPKSLDISKAIDKAKGAERAVVGEGIHGKGSYSQGMSKESGFRPYTNGLPSENNGGVHQITAPSTDAAKQWSGWGTALKPAWEPIILAMKPLDGTFAENAEKWGVAGLNVDGGRIGTEGATQRSHQAPYAESGWRQGHDVLELNKGRWPANLLLDEEAAGMLDGVSGATVSRPSGYNFEQGNNDHPTKFNNAIKSGVHHSDSGGASRFFYVAKSSRAERNEGCENGHPTVKPLELMKYLCNLTRTPTGGIVLDPFAGSGTTLWAAEYHNRPWLGIEMNPEYVAIAEARIARERAQMKLAV